MSVCPLIANADTIRVTRVDACGRPVCGDNNAFVTDCFASLAMQADIEQGTDVEFRAANGRICGFKRGCPSLRGFNTTLTFFQASPALIEILTGQPLVLDAQGNPIGWDDCSIPCRAGFAIELWAEVLGEDVCPEEAEGEGAWLYALLPWLSGGQLGDLTIGSEAVNFTLTASTRSGGRWGVGPWDVLRDANGEPGPMLTPLSGSCHRRFFVTDVAPPEPDCGYVTVEGGVCESPTSP